MRTESRVELLTRLFQSRYGLVFGVARRYAPAPDAVDDIVQQTYLEFLHAVLKRDLDEVDGQLDGETDYGPLLYRIAKRKALQLRREQYRRTGGLERLRDRLLTAWESDSSRDDEEYERNESRSRALRRCLEKLPPRSRAIVEQHYFENIPMKDIAEQQETSASAIRHFFCRVRAKLRDCIVAAIHNDLREP